jgi:hypothetical protein
MAYALPWAITTCLFVIASHVAGISGPPRQAGVVTALVLAVIWQCSPIKQRCLNRCHDLPDLATFGLAADVDVFRYGVTHAGWCVGSCWALMRLPTTIPEAHVAGMILAAVVIVAERLESPEPPSWRWRGTDKAARFLIAQARVRFAQRASAIARLPPPTLNGLEIFQDRPDPCSNRCLARSGSHHLERTSPDRHVSVAVSLDLSPVDDAAETLHRKHTAVSQGKTRNVGWLVAHGGGRGPVAGA